MVEVIWHDEALNDLRDIIRCIEQFDVDAAIAIGGGLFDLGQSLEHFPERGRPMADGTCALTTRPPSLVRYRTNGTSVEMVSVRHGRRRPLP